MSLGDVCCNTVGERNAHLNQQCNAKFVSQCALKFALFLFPEKQALVNSRAYDKLPVLFFISSHEHSLLWDSISSCKSWISKTTISGIGTTSTCTMAVRASICTTQRFSSLLGTRCLLLQAHLCQFHRLTPSYSGHKHEDRHCVPARLLSACVSMLPTTQNACNSFESNLLSLMAVCCCKSVLPRRACAKKSCCWMAMSDGVR
jgi:hypothetical protein